MTSRHSQLLDHGLSTLMVAGYGAKGVVTFLIGLVAMSAALFGGNPKGTDGVFAMLTLHWSGSALLIFIAIGLSSYVLWRLTDAALDLEQEGDNLHGYARRAGQALSGLTHAALVMSAFSIAMGDFSGGGQEATIASVLHIPFGRMVIGLVGCITLSVGTFLVFKAFTSAHEKEITQTETTRWLCPVIRYGLTARGVVLIIIGALIFFAALKYDPAPAAGLGEALQLLEQQMFGRWLLAMAGLGMVGFSAYCFARAIYGKRPWLDCSPEFAPTPPEAMRPPYEQCRPTFPWTSRSGDRPTDRQA